MLKKLKVSPAGRLVLHHFFRNFPKGNLETATMVREVMARFESKPFNRRYVHILKACAELDLPEPTWDYLTDPEDTTMVDQLVEAMANLHTAPTDPDSPILASNLSKFKVLETLLSRVQELKKPVDVTIDSHYLNWLIEELKARDWSEVQVQDRETHQMTTTHLAVNLGLLEAFADLFDTLQAAQPAVDSK